MTISAPPTTAEITEILRFLHRFADLMSTGSNSQNLLRAANLLQSHIDRLKEAEALLQVERLRADAGAGIRKSLETQIIEFESEIATLKSKLSEQQLRATNLTAEMEMGKAQLRQRAEEAEACLTEALDAAIPSGSVAVPLATLRLAKAQFDALADAFEKSGNIVSQVMCEASASSLERIILESGVTESEDSQEAAA